MTTDRPIRLLLIAGLIATPATAFAQSQVPLDDRWPAPTQQMDQRAPQATEPSAEPAAKPARPARQPRRVQAPAPAAAPGQEGEAAAPAAAPAPKPRATTTAAAKPSATNRTVACSGPFSRDSSHLALAQAFDAKNLTFTEVDGPEGSKLKASVLFPNDPKRRLEVLWNDDEMRRNTALIAINGQSTWGGPKGLKLGLGLAALEKINGKPFKLKGLDQDNPGAVIDWQGGALDSIPGDCTVGIKLAADPKVPEATKAQAAGAELLSSDDTVKALKPVVAEILFGYPQ